MVIYRGPNLADIQVQKSARACIDRQKWRLKCALSKGLPPRESISARTPEEIGRWTRTTADFVRALMAGMTGLPFQVDGELRESHEVDRNGL